MHIKRFHIFSVIISLFFIFTVSAQFDREMDNELISPVSFKIIQGKEPIKAGKESTLKIKFSVLPRYHINVIPAFKICAKTKYPGLKITATPVFDKNEMKKAKKLVAEGKAVYLDTSKEYSFKVIITGVSGVSKLDVVWTTVLYYCSEKDGLCYRKEIKSSNKLEIG